MHSETAWKASAIGRVVNAPAACAIFTQRQVEGGLVIPQAAGGRGAEREPAKAYRGIEVLGEQRGHGGAERLHGGLVAERKPGAVSLEQQVGD